MSAPDPVQHLLHVLVRPAHEPAGRFAVALHTELRAQTGQQAGFHGDNAGVGVSDVEPLP